ncbi:MAG: DUF2793 domain-containing protein [Hyphomicrobiaceae bacterium]
MATTPNLDLPYIAAAQAQKHVTHNEAIRALDAVVQLAVLDRGLTAAPSSPVDGDRYIVAAGATGSWSGHDDEIAAWQDGVWAFFAAGEGWLAWVADEAALLAFDGADWISATASAALQNVPMIGVNATADTTNRLAVASAATLFNHAGAGHQHKINKNAAADTASLLLQTGLSGRAEIGLTGNDDLTVKVSADGSSWSEAIAIDRSTGRVGIGTPAPDFPAEVRGAQATAAVTRAAADATGAHLVLRKARGTPASPAAVQADDVLGNVAIRGYDGTQYTASSRTSIRGYAAENWSGSAQGAYLAFWTTPLASTTERQAGRITPDGTLLINKNMTTLLPPAGVTGTILHMAGDDGQQARVLMDGFGNGSVGVPALIGRRARGTMASPSAVQTNDNLPVYSGFGYGATGYSASSRGQFSVVAAENWTDTAQGAYARVQATPNGSTTSGEVTRWLENGNVRIGSDGTAACKLDVDGPVRVKSHTVAGAPAASAGAGQIIYVSNETGGAVLAFSDGTNWRRVTDRAVIA